MRRRVALASGGDVKRPEQHAAEQSQVRREYDVETGRWRTIKGTGEVLEDIVGPHRQREINKAATAADGAWFLRQVYMQAVGKR